MSCLVALRRAWRGSSRALSGLDKVEGWIDLQLTSGQFGEIYKVICPKQRCFYGTEVKLAAAENLYSVLGLSKSATKTDIKKAYYALAKIHHPDVNKAKTATEKRFHDIQRAYEILSDEQKRDKYDEMGLEALEDMDNEFDEDDPFNYMYEAEEEVDLAPDVKVTLHLDFKEAVQGCSKNVSFEAKSCCVICRGNGLPRGAKPTECKYCKGTGMLTESHDNAAFQSTCPGCNGAGHFYKERCSKCGGRGTIKSKRTARFDIPAGVDSGTVLKLPNEGNFNRCDSRQGDLLVTLKVQEDRIFRRAGSNVHVDAVISSTLATLGGTVCVPTLTGDAVLKVNKGTQHGQKVVLRGKGIKAVESNKPGDLFIHFKITPD